MKSSKSSEIRLSERNVKENINTLMLRIRDRFPKSGLYKACQELGSIAKETGATIRLISRPIPIFRIGAILMIAGFLTAVVVLLTQHDTGEQLSLYSMIQTLEAGANLLILIGLAMVFLWSSEQKIRRRRVVSAINRLRDLAHIIDMKQLTKHPDAVAKESRPTTHSPKQELNAYELGRYLDYCSEMLSLISKVGYLYISKFNDPVATNAVNELENLTTGLSRKIWQKIMILRTGAV
ncbi:MAG: hypothetical protein GY731_15760 [Gammaproteobacteria bacterium]|nr:hypothetical protein [Gammaproteobacteria bacterium]